MNLDAIALELWENSATYPEIRAALAQVRDEALEEGAKWHGQMASEIPYNDPAALVHRESAACLRAMKGKL